MTVAPTLDQNARQAGGLDLFTAGQGLAAAADTSAVVQWAQRLAVVRSAVEIVIETPFVPASYWPLPRGVTLKDFPTPYLVHPSEDMESYGHRRRIATATATLAALHGEQYGWQPGQSWRLLYVVHGRVGIGYEGVGALLRGAGFGVRVLERSAERAAVEITRPGAAAGVTYEFTMTDAELAGYVPGKGPNTGSNAWKGNAKYNTDPKTMLLARAITIGGRVEAPDVIAGMSVVELFDDEPAIAEPVQLTAGPAEKPKGAGSAKLRQLVETPAVREARASVALDRDQTHSVDDARPPLSGEADEQAAYGVTESQLRKLGAVFTDLGVKGAGERAERLRIAGDVVGRRLGSSRDLSKREAQHLIDTLEGLDAAGRAKLLGSPAEEPEPAGPPLPGEEARPVDPWGINDPTGGADPDTVDDDLPVPGDES